MMQRQERVDVSAGLATPSIQGFDVSIVRRFARPREIFALITTSKFARSIPTSLETLALSTKTVYLGVSADGG